MKHFNVFIVLPPHIPLCFIAIYQYTNITYKDLLCYRTETNTLL